MPRQLTESQVHSFTESPVWVEIVKQLHLELTRNLTHAIDDDNRMAAGAYRAIEMVLSLPARFLAEIDNGDSSNNDISRLRKKA